MHRGIREEVPTPGETAVFDEQIQSGNGPMQSGDMVTPGVERELQAPGNSR